jgi:DNA-directed RNA polymerase subunit RPC12/RpoP
MTECEVYKLECFACDGTVELPAADGQLRCPNCSAILQVEWNGARANLERQ